MTESVEEKAQESLTLHGKGGWIFEKTEIAPGGIWTIIAIPFRPSKESHSLIGTMFRKGKP